MIYDPHNTHERQEEEDAFPKEEARGAVRHTSRICVSKSVVLKRVWLQHVDDVSV